jgi:acyl carrier protein
MDELPLTPTGKIDRRALHAVEAPAAARPETYAAPRTPVEEALAGVWAQLLGLERVSIHDNFFELGGHSLTATRLVSRLRADFGVELPLRAVFEAQTIAEQAEVVAGQGGPGRPAEESLPAIVALPRQARRATRADLRETVG